MSEYTPTTDQVRARYCAGWTGIMSNEYGEAFDRWLEQVKAEAWEEGHEAAAMRVPEGVWHDTASPRLPNPYRQEQDA